MHLSTIVKNDLNKKIRPSPIFIFYFLFPYSPTNTSTKF